MQDFDQLELIIKERIFNSELLIAPEEHKLLLTEPPNNHKQNREKLVQMMIEGFNVRKVYLGQQAVLALFASGRSTGTVIDSGAGSTHVVPVQEGYPIAHAVRSIDVSGDTLTDFLVKSLLANPESATRLPSSEYQTR